MGASVRGAALVLVAAAAALALSGCGQDGTDDDAPATAEPGATAIAQTTTVTDNPYQELRSMALTVTAQELGLSPSPGHQRVWGVIMDVGLPDGTATLVVMGDGAVSLYTSTGGGIIGAGTHETVQAAAADLFAEAEASVASFQPARQHPLPEAGSVQFHLRTFDGDLRASAEEGAIAGGADPLSRLFFAAQDVLTAMRQADQPQ